MIVHCLHPPLSPPPLPPPPPPSCVALRQRSSKRDLSSLSVKPNNGTSFFTFFVDGFTRPSHACRVSKTNHSPSQSFKVGLHAFSFYHLPFRHPDRRTSPSPLPEALGVWNHCAAPLTACALASNRLLHSAVETLSRSLVLRHNRNKRERPKEGSPLRAPP